MTHSEKPSKEKVLSSPSIEKEKASQSTNKEAVRTSIQTETDRHAIEEVRAKLFKTGEEGDRHFRMRHSRERTVVPLSEQDRKLIAEMAREGVERLSHNYEPGFGVYPSPNPDENFYRQVWTRDAAHAGGNYFSTQRPEALKDSLNTIIAHQKENSMLPFRTEKEYMLLKVIPFIRRFAKSLFTIIEHRLRGREERPVYEEQDFSGAEDTVPSVLIAAGEYFIESPDGKKFAAENYESLTGAADFFKTKVDQTDGLASLQVSNPDWADSIRRGGKLGTINVLWARSLRFMSAISFQLGKTREAEAYRKEFHKTKRSVLDKLYDKEGAYFRAEEGTDRIDTVASVFGSLYLLSPEECVSVQEALKKRVATPSGLKNFDPPYPAEQILFGFKLIKGHERYHNTYVWPWVTCQNIQVKIKIALEHPDEATRNQYKAEAVADLVDMARLFKEAGGAYEVFEPETRKPATNTLYKPPVNFMANFSAYEGAYIQLKSLGWI